MTGMGSRWEASRGNIQVYKKSLIDLKGLLGRIPTLFFKVT